jgi:hypothetical protein
MKLDARAMRLLRLRVVSIPHARRYWSKELNDGKHVETKMPMTKLTHHNTQRTPN